MDLAVQKDVDLSKEEKKDLLIEKHVFFIANYGKLHEIHEYIMSDFLRLSGLYWSLAFLDVVGRVHELDENQILNFVEECFDPATGGYRPCPGHDVHLLFTLNAIQIAVTLRRLDVIDRDKVVNFVKNLQQKDGSFAGDEWGEIDTRFSFCAIYILTVLNKLDAIDLDKSIEFVESCRNFDGGFGCVPGAESHAGQIYCCVGFLSIVGRLDLVDADQLGWWLCERQLPSGGLNGRPEKLPDVCYSWWVLSSLAILGRLHWIDVNDLVKFILACQDCEVGGFSDRPGDVSDPFHTLFGVAGLSLTGLFADKLKSVNPVFCLTNDVVDGLNIRVQILC